MADGPKDAGLRSSVRRAVDGAFDATVGRVGHTVTEAAMEVTGATAQQVIEDLEPYLIQEAIPRIVDGLTPYLTDSLVPEVLEGITAHLVADTVPDIVDGVTAHLVAVTVPEVVDGVTPRLVADLLPKLLEDLRPYLEAELVPRIVEGLVPYIQEQVAPELVEALMPKIRDEVAPELIEALMPRIEEQVAPRVVDALMPKIRDEVAPDLVDALMPKIRDQVAPDLVHALIPRIRDEVAPQLVDALLPKIQEEVAPQLVDALLPKIRAEVVPLILDDIVDDPRVRDLIREQSQGLLLDALESVRENLADADVLVERVGRRLLRRSPRPQPESAVTLMLDAAGDEDTTPARLTRENLAEQRAVWRAMPVTPAPPGREFAHAGAVTRLVAFAVDSTLVAWLVSQGLSALVSLLDTVFDPAPSWLIAILTGIAASLMPVYLAVCWWLAGRTVGSMLVGTRVCTPDGRNPGLVRALIRAWVGVLGFLVWIITGVVSLFDRKRRSVLDLVLSTEVRYVVPLDQQRRYIREAVQARHDRAAAVQAPSGPAAGPPTDGA